MLKVCLTLFGVLCVLNGCSSMYLRETGPPAPEHVEVIIQSENSIMVTWDKPDHPVAGYRVYYSMFGPDDINLWPHVEVGDVTFTLIGDLEPWTVYYARVQAISLNGDLGAISPEVRPKVLPHFR